MRVKQAYNIAKKCQQSGKSWKDAEAYVAQTASIRGQKMTPALIEAVKEAYKTKALPQFPVLLNPGAEDPKPHPKSVENFRVLFEDIMQLDLRYNELKDAVYVNGSPITDRIRSHINNKAREYAFSDARDVITDMLSAIAEDQSYHPFKEAVESVQPDGADHIRALFNELQLTDEASAFSDWYAEYVKRWLVAMVKRVYEPGSQNLVLVLLGAQGTGKSRFIAKLNVAPEAYKEGPINTESKDDLLCHLKYNIWNVEELDGVTRKRDVSALKAFLTQTEVSARPAYGIYEKTGKSQLSFIASVNSEDFLHDATGNRRFLVIPIKGLNANHKVDMLQVFAQAKALYESGYKFYFDSQEISTIEKLNSDYLLQDRVQIIADNVEPGETFMDLYQIMHAVLGELAERRELDKSELSKLGTLLSRKGIQKKRDPKRKGAMGYAVKTTAYQIEKVRASLFGFKGLSGADPDEDTEVKIN